MKERDSESQAWNNIARRYAEKKKQSLEWDDVMERIDTQEAKKKARTPFEDGLVELYHTLGLIHIRERIAHLAQGKKRVPGDDVE